MKLTNDIIVAAVSGSLGVIKSFIDSEKFDKIVDDVLNGVEAHFEEGSTADNVAETVCAAIRKRLDVPDSDPNN